MTVRAEWWFMWFLIVVATIVAGFDLLHRLTFDDRVPVYFDRAEALNSPVPEGERLLVRIHREKYRDDCPVISNRRAQDADGRWFDIPNMSHSGGAAHTPYIDFEYDTSALPAGQYVLMVRIDYQCPGFVHSVDQPPVFFRVE